MCGRKKEIVIGRSDQDEASLFIRRGQTLSWLRGCQAARPGTCDCEAGLDSRPVEWGVYLPQPRRARAPSVAGGRGGGGGGGKREAGGGRRQAAGGRREAGSGQRTADSDVVLVGVRAGVCACVRLCVRPGRWSSSIFLSSSLSPTTNLLFSAAASPVPSNTMTNV